MIERDAPGSGPGVQTDPELPTVQGQLIVFARELGELYRLERSRNAELETVLESLRDTYLATILSSEGQGPSRGEAVKVGLPEEEMLLARRRVERLVADAEISDPGTLDDERLAAAVELLVREEREVSQARNDVLHVMNALQEELKRRYRDDPSLVLS